MSYYRDVKAYLWSCANIVMEGSPTQEWKQLFYKSAHNLKDLPLKGARNNLRLETHLFLEKQNHQFLLERMKEKQMSLWRSPIIGLFQRVKKRPTYVPTHLPVCGVSGSIRIRRPGVPEAVEASDPEEVFLVIG